MAFERFLTAVPPQGFIEAGTALGRIVIFQPFLFKVRQLVVVEAVGQPTLELQVKRVEDFAFFVGPNDNRPDTRTDLSAYTVALLAAVFSGEQQRPWIVDDQAYQPEEYEHDEEPTNAKRVVLVGAGGRRVETVLLNNRGFLGNEPLEKQLKLAVDYNGDGNPELIGEAAPGSSKLAPVWRLRQVLYDGLNATDILWADGNTQFDNPFTQPTPASGGMTFGTYFPVDGDTITVGSETFEFDDDSAVSGGNFPATIVAGDIIATLTNFIISVGTNSTSVAFDQDDTVVSTLTIAISALVAGTVGNTIPFSTNQPSIKLASGPPPFTPETPYTGFLAGGLDVTPFFN